MRVWVPACATGEEAYSIAMLLAEHARQLETPPALQVFACDLDEESIQKARAGLYPETISADVSEERLRRYFVKDARGYRVRRELREMVLFAAHDLLKDAPFSRMDLISCRNLLIYLNRDAQSRVFEIFHFSLLPQSVLFLGTSESIEEGNALFRVLDKKNRIYAPQPALRPGLPVPGGPSLLQSSLEARERALGGAPVVHGRSFLANASMSFPGLLSRTPDRAALTDLHYKLVERLAPPSILINAEHEIVHISESAGRFLRVAGGEPTSNLLRLIHPALRIQLRAALFRAQETNATIDAPHLPLEIEGEMGAIHLRVSPAQEMAPGFLLVIFEKEERAPHDLSAPKTVLPDGTEPWVRQLERELEMVKSQLRDTVEQYEASGEEMKASNEELQAMNEELRSATEELETSREELQSHQ